MYFQFCEWRYVSHNGEYIVIQFELVIMLKGSKLCIKAKSVVLNFLSDVAKIIQQLEM